MDFPFLIPFVHELGIELLSSGAGQSCLQLALRPSQTNQMGMAHGGILMTLLDVTMAQAARSSGPDRSLITIEMKTTFFRPAIGVLTARGNLQHGTARMAYVEATVFDAESRKCAQATGTFRFVEPRHDPTLKLQDPQSTETTNP